MVALLIADPLAPEARPQSKEQIEVQLRHLSSLGPPKLRPAGSLWRPSVGTAGLTRHRLAASPTARPSPTATLQEVLSRPAATALVRPSAARRARPAAVLGLPETLLRKESVLLAVAVPLRQSTAESMAVRRSVRQERLPIPAAVAVLAARRRL